MEDERTAQLIKLWEWLPRPTGDHVIRLFARDASGGVIGDYARSLNELFRFVRSLDGRYNIYVGLNPTTSTAGTRHSASDVTHWSFFPIDIDPVQPDANPYMAMFHIISMMDKEFNLGGATPITVDSGRGIQLWYRLADYPLVDEDYWQAEDDKTITFKRAVPRRAMQYWLKKLGESQIVKDAGCCIDTSVSDLPRVMRCPGTINLKTGRRSGIMHDLSSVLSSLGWDMVRTVPPKTFDNEPRTVVHSLKSWQEAFPHLTKKAQDYLTLGKREPGRHAVMWHTAMKLHEVGIEEEQIRSALLYANSILGPDNAVPRRDIERTLSQIYGGK